MSQARPSSPLCELRVFPHDEEASRAGAVSFAAHARRAIEARGRFAVALSGGETPRRMYEMLAEDPIAREVPWEHVHLFWGDERGVPPDHPRSNFRMAQEALVARVPLPAGNVHRVPAELPAGEAARRYEHELRAFFGAGDAMPTFDLVHLGVGDDGHTASLFPGDPALREVERAVVATVDRAHGDEGRVTLTLPVINAARAVEVLVLEPEKAELVRRVVFGGAGVDELPVAGVAPRGSYVWLLSEAAAARLPGDVSR